MGSEVRRRLQQCALISGLVLLCLAMGVSLSCQGLPKNVANCPVTPVPPADTSIVPPASEPPPAALCGFPITVANPAKGASVHSPMPFVATATPPDPVYIVRVYVDGQAILYSPLASLNTFIWMPNGQHTVEMVAEDVAGYIATSSFNVNVVAQDVGVTNLQNRQNWTSCSAVISGSTCAAGLGVAESTLTQHQSSPSLDGSASRFSMGGKTPYSNELYWIPLGGGNNVSHFTYDLWFYIDNGDAPQSLEFDINQTFGGTRWTWGSQCDFNQDHVWDIWDPNAGLWRNTPIPCNHFPSNTWIHLVWKVERVGNQVHYLTLSVGDQTYNVDTYYDAQQGWTQEEIDVAFQMDGNWEQQAYNVWLDEVNLLGN